MSQVTRLVDKIKARVGNDPTELIKAADALEAETKNSFFGTRWVIADVCRELRHLARQAARRALTGKPDQ